MADVIVGPRFDQGRIVFTVGSLVITKQVPFEGEQLGKRSATYWPE